MSDDLKEQILFKKREIRERKRKISLLEKLIHDYSAEFSVYFDLTARIASYDVQLASAIEMDDGANAKKIMPILSALVIRRDHSSRKMKKLQERIFLERGISVPEKGAN